MPAYAHPTASPRDPNASGIAAESTKLATISASNIDRTGNFCGSSQFVTQFRARIGPTATKVHAARCRDTGA